MKYSAPRGTKDVLPEEACLWQFVEKACRDIFASYNYKEIRTPIFESTDIFSRSIGVGTDIVNKEMYTFLDRKGRSLTLRPEETAAVVRAGLENNLISPENVTKLYYIGPMFRYERPQAGRQRQFHQAGVEVFGTDDPLIDAEVIAMNLDLFEKIGLKEAEVGLNSVGCKVCKPNYSEAIKNYFSDKIKNMCADCNERLLVNPMRILDCKEAGCQKYIENAPTAIDSLCGECKIHFDLVQDWLKRLGVKYKINNRLVRGLDYYTKTVFEVVSKQLGAQNAVCGGGRYNNLVEEFGGKPTPAIGFAIGLERIIEIAKKLSTVPCPLSTLDFFIATLGDLARKKGIELASALRKQGISVDLDYQGKTLKAQMKAADRMKAKYVYIIGDDEIPKGSAMLKNMQTAVQEEVAFESILEKLRP